ncbi:MAG: OadG family protein [Oscillospiraceae bacterium]|nr:OadG family protein [Oscillospiraceae bacterium]
MTGSASITIPQALGTAVLGYAVVFLGLVLLMAVLLIAGKLMHREKKAASAPVPETLPAQASAGPAPKAPGAAGELKLYDTDPRDAAMVMAIVADSLGKPLNELRFISIREVHEDEV